MILDNGRIIEFDSPGSLIKKEGGLFKSLVDGSNDSSALYAVVKDSVHRSI